MKGLSSHYIPGVRQLQLVQSQFKVSNRNISKRREICSSLTIRTSKRYHCRHSVVFTVNFEHVSCRFSSVLLLALNRYFFLSYDKITEKIHDHGLDKTCLYFVFKGSSPNFSSNIRISRRIEVC